MEFRDDARSGDGSCASAGVSDDGWGIDDVLCIESSDEDWLSLFEFSHLDMCIADIEDVCSDTNMDYCNIHIWPANWGWASKKYPEQYVV